MSIFKKKPEKIRCKAILVGGYNTGKTQIIHSFEGNSFAKSSYLTSSYTMRTIYLENNNSVTLDIGQTDGQNQEIKNLYFKNSKVIIFVFDFTNKKSFDGIKNYWYEEVKKYIQNLTQFLLSQVILSIYVIIKKQQMKMKQKNLLKI